MAEWTRSEKLRIEDLHMESSALTAHPIMGHTSLDDILGTAEPNYAIALPSEVKNAEHWTLTGLT